MERLTLTAPAKINLALVVGERREDGLHELASVLQRIDVCDTLELAEGAGLTLHVRLVEGRDPQHVLEAIFKALGTALSQACALRAGKE